MDEVIKDAIGRYGAKIVGLDDRFEFHCTECGKCCTNREDILLTPRDLFRASKGCGMEVDNFFKENCEIYIGCNSRLPIVRFKPRGSVRRCPMLENRRCRIHKAKPVVCAMYPVGRAMSLNRDTGEVKVCYLINRTICGDSSKKHTILSWLTESGVELNDAFYVKWSRLLPELHTRTAALELRCTRKTIITAWDLMSWLMYFHYDTTKSFDAQFDENADCLLRLLDKLLEDNAEGEP